VSLQQELPWDAQLLNPLPKCCGIVRIMALIAVEGLAKSLQGFREFPQLEEGYP
jgi:hypothetical protein